MRLLHWVLDLLYPPKCVFCGALLQTDETDLCGKCRLSLPTPHSPLRHAQFIESCYSLFSYQGVVAASIKRYKFYGRQQYAPAYGRLLAMALLRENPQFDLISWVPISARRRRKRGYDQAKLLAQSLAKELHSDCVCTLRKTRDNPSQSSRKSAAERRANVMNVFAAVEPERFADKRILLIDDIITTGSTLSACAHVLLTAGAAKVVCATLAATEP